MILQSVNSYQASFIITNEELTKNGCDIEHGITQAAIEIIMDEVIHQLSMQTDLCTDKLGFTVEMFKANSTEFICVVTDVSKYYEYKNKQWKEEYKQYVLRTTPLILCQSLDSNVIIQVCNRLDRWFLRDMKDSVSSKFFRFPVKSSLYYTNEGYQIVISEITDMNLREDLLAIAGEYCYVSGVPNLYGTYLEEHGKRIVIGLAIQQMSELY